MELLTTEEKDDFLAQAGQSMDRLIDMVVKAKRCTKGECLPLHNEVTAQLSL